MTKRKKPRRIWVVECACQNWLDAYHYEGDATACAERHDTSRCRRVRVLTFEEVQRGK